MSGARRALDGLWREPAPPARLAVLRILAGGYCVRYLWRRRAMLRRVSKLDASLFDPVGVVRLRQPLDPRAFRGLLATTLATNLAFVLGWRYRYTGPGFAASLLALLSYRNSWSMVYHNDNVLVMHILALGLSPAADALSVDARSFGTPPPRRLRRGLDRLVRRESAAPARGAEGHWRYGWPIRLMNVATVLTYFVAGVAKLKGPLGVGWAKGESLRSQVAVDALRKELLGDGAPPLAFSLYDRVALFRLLALGSLVVEVGAPLVLLDRRLARAWALNALAMHWGIFFMMGIKFRYQLSGLQFVPFFDVEWAATRLVPASRPA